MQSNSTKGYYEVDVLSMNYLTYAERICNKRLFDFNFDENLCVAAAQMSTTELKKIK